MFLWFIRLRNSYFSIVLIIWFLTAIHQVLLLLPNVLVGTYLLIEILLNISFIHSFTSPTYQRFVFWHQEVASDSFCFLINSSWLLVFILYVFSIFFLGFNLYCWKGIHFSQNLDLILLYLFLCLLIIFHLWFRDLLRELNKKYEILLIVLFLIFLIFIISEGLLFISFFWTSFHSLSSPSYPMSCWLSRVSTSQLLIRDYGKRYVSG